MATTLYIIGNGFDRYHKLPTSYQSFAFLLKKSNPDLYDMFIKYYGLPDLDETDEQSKYDPLWADFENALADLDFESVLEDNINYLGDDTSDHARDFHTYQIQMEGIVKNLTEDLYREFKQFIQAVEFPESDVNNLISIKPGSQFLSFNYTNTLEQYYGINPKNILYIHGKGLNPNDTLILGHGRDPATLVEDDRKEPIGLSDEDLERWREEQSDNYSYSYQTGKDELTSYFNSSFKFTDDIINQNKPFFGDLEDIKEIIVLGHSIAEVDQPYFKKVIQETSGKNIPWTVSYHSDSDQQSHLEKLIKLGLNEEQIHLVKMDSLKVNNPSLF